MTWYRRTLSAEAEAMLARARAASEIQHPGVKGDAVESLFADFLRNILPHRFSVGTGVIIGSESKTSGQVDIIVHDNAGAAYPTVADTVTAESVYAAVEVKTSVEGRHLTKAMGDAHTIKDLPRRASRLRFANPKSSTLKDVSFRIPPLIQCSIVALSSKPSLVTLARYWHHYFLDVPFGGGVDCVLVLDSGHIGLGSWLPQSGDPLNTVSPLYNLAPENNDTSKDHAILIFPDIFAKNWEAEYPIRIGPRVPLAIGSRLYITVNECGIDALGIWFRLLWGFISSQFAILGEHLPNSLGTIEEAFPSPVVDSVLPLAIAVDPEVLESNGGKYAVDMVYNLLTQTG